MQLCSRTCLYTALEEVDGTAIGVAACRGEDHSRVGPYILAGSLGTVTSGYAILLAYAEATATALLPLARPLARTPYGCYAPLAQLPAIASKLGASLERWPGSGPLPQMVAPMDQVPAVCFILTECGWITGKCQAQ